MDVTVASVSAEDCDAFVAAVRASHDLHHAWINPADSAERFEEWLERLSRDDEEANLIRHESCGAPVGYVSVSNIVRRAFQSADLGYGALPSHAGRGLMAQGLGARRAGDQCICIGLHQCCPAQRRTGSARVAKLLLKRRVHGDPLHRASCTPERETAGQAPVPYAREAPTSVSMVGSGGGI